MRLIFILLFFLASCTEAQITITGASVSGVSVGANDLVNVTSVSGFSSTIRYTSSNGTGPNANLTAFTCWAVVLPNVQANTQLIFGRTNATTSSQGWSLNCSVGQYRFSMGDGSAAIHSPTFGVTAEEENKIQIIHGKCVSGVLYIYKNGVLQDGSTAIGAHTVSGFGTNIGSFSGGEQYRSSIIAAGVASNTAMSDSDVEAHYQALRTNPYATPTGATNLWRSADADNSSWVDVIGSISCTRNGSPTITSSQNYVYTRWRAADHAASITPKSPQFSNVAGQVDVMFIGDSRTDGVGGTTTLSFRQGVYTLYSSSGDLNNINFVGPSGSAVTDPQHHGLSGTTSSAIENTNSGGIASVMSTYDPDIVVLLIGTNSMGSDANLATEKAAYLSLVRAIKTAKSSIRIVVVEEMRRSEAIPRARIEAFNNYLWYVAWPTLESEGVDITKVKMYDTVLPSAGDYNDSVHLNDQGYGKMDDPIYAGIRLAAGY